jgi:multiple sugar transport system substrate-binding protein
MAPLPFGDNQATLLLANMFIVPASCKSVDLANEFIATALRSDVQETMSRTAHFLSVLKHVNEQVGDKPFLESINITNRQVENSYFLHEIFPDASVMEELETEMKLFWAGLESATSFTQTLLRVISNRVRGGG